MQKAIVLKNDASKVNLMIVQQTVKYAVDVVDPRQTSSKMLLIRDLLKNVADRANIFLISSLDDNLKVPDYVRTAAPNTCWLFPRYGLNENR